MGKNKLSERDAWQGVGGTKATDAEHSFYSAFQKLFDGTSYTVTPRPKELRQIYVDVFLSDDTLSEIYIPDEPIKKHGITPDYKITNIKTGKILYVEVKRQDGWVEGKPRSAGRGNAHERCCKYFTPGLLKILRRKSGIKEPDLPFWTVFQGNITRDPCRVREIAFWFDEFPHHYFFWRNTKDPRPLLEHFEKKLKHLLR